MPDFLLIRHGESVFNTQHRLNGDPSVDNPLSPLGREQCQALASTVGTMQWASTWTTRFPRTKESLTLIAPDTTTQPEELPQLDDIDVGVFEGRPIDEFRAWRRENGPATPVPQGESLVQAVERYAHGLLYLLDHAPRPALVILHDQPIRYVMNAQAGDDPFRGALRKVPNAVPYPFSAAALRLAANRLDERGDRGDQ
jgi:2,3-bisphosphoglycerate-dependent phosphoglycerate mutase